MTRLLSSFAIAALIALNAAVPAVASDATGLRRPPTIVKLSPVGSSRQSGSVRLRQSGAQVVMSGSVDNVSPDQMEPVELVEGSCGSKGRSLLDVGPVAGAMIGSRLIPHTTIAQLHAMHASIRVYKSEKEMGTIVSCGNI